MTNSDAKNIQISYPKSKTSPWINQLEAWRRQAGHDGYYYAMDMGVGKSKAAIDYANGHDANTVLIICPKKVMPVWPDQFDTHSFADYYPLIFEKDIPIRKKAQIIEDKYQYAKLRGKRLAVILNYDAFWRPPLGHDYDGKTNRIL
jgi:SNF2 family DNA or RNA helicase